MYIKKKLLLIALLIVGCDTSTAPEETCEICDVAWIFNSNESRRYYTRGYEPDTTLIDTLSLIEFTLDITQCNEYNLNLSSGEEAVDCATGLMDIDKCRDYDHFFVGRALGVGCGSFFSYSFVVVNDTIQHASLVLKISHIISPNIFKIYPSNYIPLYELGGIIYGNVDPSIVYNSDEIKYEYK